jgi:hypothetical protein
MFTVLSNTRNSNLYMIVALAVMVVALLAFAIVPAISAPKSALAPEAAGSDVTSDYYQRHPELNIGVAPASVLNADFFERHPDWVNKVQILGVPVTGLSEIEDYFQRHTVPGLPAASSLETADYFTRHPELRSPTRKTDLSDYFLRH